MQRQRDDGCRPSKLKKGMRVVVRGIVWLSVALSRRRRRGVTVRRRVDVFLIVRYVSMLSAHAVHAPMHLCNALYAPARPSIRRDPFISERYSRKPNPRLIINYSYSRGALPARETL